MTILENDLEVHKPDDRLHRNSASLDYHDTYVERECTRRCFWFIQCMSWINGIYTYKPMRPRSVELMPYVRLPIDETNFELTVYSNSASEYRFCPSPVEVARLNAVFSFRVFAPACAANALCIAVWSRVPHSVGIRDRAVDIRCVHHSLTDCEFPLILSSQAMKDGPARDAAVADSARDLAVRVSCLCLCTLFFIVNRPGSNHYPLTFVSPRRIQRSRRSCSRPAQIVVLGAIVSCTHFIHVVR